MPLLLLLLCCLLVPVTGGAQFFDNPHQKTHACRLEFRSDCDSVCLVCHTPARSSSKIYPTPWNPSGLTLEEVYGDLGKAAGSSPQVAKLEGDIGICVTCHLDYLGEGNHPVGMVYEADDIAAKLVSDPEGPKLFCAQGDGPCTVLCSTCHDPHELESPLMRTDNRASALCTACHRK